MAKMKSYEKGSVGAKGIEKALQMAIEDMPEDYDPEAMYDSKTGEKITDKDLQQEAADVAKANVKGRVKRSKGSPKSGENVARLNATRGQTGSGQVSRGGGAALAGISFKGVF
tara:strand:+ start:147 stop:485 length:339 start_codon:yes stop_codon:yes gene_type:complete